MLATRRQQEIVQRLRKDGHVTTKKLAESLQVSSVTIRRDLKILEKQGILRRSYGGATLVDNGHEQPGHLALERTYVEKAKFQYEAKARIGQAAAALVKDGETILLEAGTTVAAMLPQLRRKRGLTVVTNALNVAWDLINNSDARVVFLGGQVRPSSYAAVGQLTEKSLEQITVQRLFLGADGITVEAGVTTPNTDEASLARQMMAKARDAYVLADHTKFGRVALARIAPITAFTKIITDDQLNEQYGREVEASGVALHRV